MNHKWKEEELRIFADLHIHSRFSRATSKKMDIDGIARFAEIKGLDVVGTGDFTHPEWLKELQANLGEMSSTGLFRPAKTTSQIRFMITGEVSTIFTFGDETKKIHHLILTPSFETAAQINDRLTRYGDLSLDGRPTLEMSAPHLVEEVMAVSPWNEVVPAHVWTPWFSLFGAFSGFDRIEDCYQDMTRNIHALETGLSSDPPMNWRLSALDKFTLVSNSDSHSYWPWRMGREANVFDLGTLAYNEVVDAVRSKDTERFKFTIETNPAYGKYHWTGHRNCGVSMPPHEAMKFNNLCPVCRRKLTKGVEQRIEELADRPEGFKPSRVTGYMRLLPLSEIIAAVLNASSPSLESVWQIYNNLITRFGSEYAVLIDATMKEIAKVSDLKIAEAVVKVREEKARVTPGYDGVYGQLVLFEEEKAEKRVGKVPQRSLTEWV
jgi:uncharacterized protein (TIGR00375 family)